MRTRLPIAALFTCAASTLLASPASSVAFPSEMWVHEGVAITDLTGDQSNPKIIADGSGGMFVTWRDASTGHVSIQRVLPNGAIAPGWPAGGRLAHSGIASPTTYSVARDDAGGAFVVAVDARDGTSRAYGYHILFDGTNDPVWNAAGLVIVGGRATTEASAYRDGSGGLMVLFDFDTPPTSWQYRVIHLDAAGNLAPNWQVGGVIIATSALATNELVFAEGVEDGQGGLYVTHLIVSYPTCTGHGCPENPQFYQPFFLVRDGGIEWSVLPNGAHLGAWLYSDGLGGVVATEIYTGSPPRSWQRRLPHGEIEWSVGPPLLSGDPFELVGDGLGGALVRHLPQGYDGSPFFLRLDDNGAIAPGWPAPDGIASARATGPMIADGTGGGYVAWNDESLGTGRDLFGARFSIDGQFSPDGTGEGTLLVGAAGAQSEAQLLTDGDEGFYLVWTDERAGNKDVYAQRFGFDAPVPVELAFVEATVGEGAVHLSWYATDAATAAFRLERADARTPWSEVAAEFEVRGSLLQWTDRTVAAGETYSYRLAWGEGRYSEDVSVAVPASGDAGMTALLGPSRQPMRAGDRLRFRLATPGEGAIEIFDVRGQRLSRVDLTGRTAGEHEITLDRNAGLRPGVYWARLVHGVTTQKLKFVYVD